MKCIACKSKIPDGATLCSLCKAHQSPWKNWLPYLAGVVAVLFLIASAATYIARNSVALWKSITWNDEVKVLNYKSLEKGVFLNTGDGEVFLLRLVA